MTTPLRSFMWGTNTQFLCFLGVDGHVHAMAMIRPGTSDWVHYDISKLAHASTTYMDPNPQDAQTLAGYEFIVLDQHGQTIEDTVHTVYLGVDGSIHEAYAHGDTLPLSWNDHVLTAAAPYLGRLPLTGSVPTTPLGGYEFVVYNEGDTIRESTEHVIYLDTSGVLHNLEYSPGKTWFDEKPDINVKPLVTGSLATPIAAYSFVAYYPAVPIETTEHIIYIDSNHRLHELWRPAGSAFWADELLPGKPLVLDVVVTPLAAYTLYVLDNDNNLKEVSEHVIYVGTDKALHELYNVRQPYQSGWIDGVLPTEVPPLTSAVQMTPLAGFSLFSSNIVSTSQGDIGPVWYYDIQEISEHVIYIGADGKLRELYNVLSGTPGWVDHALPTKAKPLFITPTFTGHRAETTPVAGHSFVVNYDDGSLAESTMHVFYIDQDSNLHEMYYAVPGNGEWEDRNLTQQLGVHPAT